MAIWDRITGGIVSFAIGRASATALDPKFEPVRQEQWRLNPNRVLELEVLGAIVGQALADEGSLSDYAERNGYGADKLAYVAELARTAPSTAELLRMLLRGKISRAQAVKGLHKASIPDEWHDALLELEFLRLSPADLANAEQQGFTDIISIPQEAAEIGLTPDRLELLHQLAGLPPGVETGLAMLRRSIIDDSLFAELVRTGHTKTKWTPQLLELRAQVLSMDTYARLWLKGWISQAEANAGGALTGFEPADVERQYLSMGRPAAPQQMATAIARGVEGPDGVPMDEAQFLKGIRESDIRPEWGPMLFGIRYSYPPLFQINRLVTGGAISPATALDWAEKDRYAPEVVDALRAYWSTAGGAAGKELTKAEALDEYEGGFITEAELRTLLANLGETQHAIDLLVHLGDARRVKRARDSAVTVTEKGYVGHDLTRAQALAELSALGVSDQAAGELVHVWDLELGIGRKTLTEAELLRAWRRGVITAAEVTAELLARGYTLPTISILLGETFTPLTDKEVQTAYGAGTITLAEATAYLAANGKTPDEISVLLAGITPKPPTP